MAARGGMHGWMDGWSERNACWILSQAGSTGTICAHIQAFVMHKLCTQHHSKTFRLTSTAKNKNTRWPDQHIFLVQEDCWMDLVDWLINSHWMDLVWGRGLRTHVSYRGNGGVGERAVNVILYHKYLPYHTSINNLKTQRYPTIVIFCDSPWLFVVLRQAQVGFCYIFCLGQPLSIHAIVLEHNASVTFRHIFEWCYNLTILKPWFGLRFFLF
jgi:hypothetical protein